MEIPADRSLKFTEGNLGTFSVDMTNATVETNVAFAEGEYVVIAKNGSKYYAMKGVKGSGDFMSYAQVEYDGTATTFTPDDETLVWTIAAADGGFTLQNNEGKYLYGSNSGNNAYLGNAQTLTITPVDGTTQQYNIGIKSISERILAFNTNSGQERFAFYKGTQVHDLYLVPVVENNTPYFTVTPTEYTFSAGGGEAEFEIKAMNGFNAEVTATTDAEWLTLSSDDNIVCAEAAMNEDAARSATITFSAEGCNSVEVTVKQEAAENSGEEDDDTMTIAKFLDLKDTATEYTLTGKITSVANTTYGNFNLTDATGTVYVYGLLTPEGTAQKQWAAAGLKQGDVITIKGKYSVYNNSPQIKNAVYVSHYGLSLDNTNIEFDAEGGSKTVNVTLTNTTEAIEISNSNSHFSVTNSGNVITIVAPKNETDTVLSGTITVTVGMADATITVAQAYNSSSNEPAWTLVTDVNTLVAGDQIVIVASQSNVALSTNQRSNNRGQADVTKLNNTVTLSSDVQIITLEAGNVDNTFAFNVGSAGYLYAASSSSNYLRTVKTLSNNSSWKIEITSAGIATIKAQGSNTRNWMRYNSQSSVFACYSSGQNDISIYKYTSSN